MRTVKEYNKLYNWNIPEVCPVCGSEIVIDKSGFPYCPNELCPRKTAHRFKKMFDIFGIKGTGSAFIVKLEEENISIIDFLNIIKSENTKALNDFAGGINGEKIFIQMKEALSKPISAAEFLATFDVKNFDVKKLKLLGNLTLDEIMSLSFEDIIKFEGFAETTASLLIEFLTKYKSEIDELKNYFTFLEKRDIIKESGKLENISFCFTGKAVKPRNELQGLVEQNGGINKSSVTKGLNYLVTDDTDSSSSKMKKAKELGIKIISSTDFLGML